MINMKTIGVVLMASSIIDKKSPRPGCRAEHRATDLRERTRRKSSSLSLGRLDLPPYYSSQAFEIRHFTPNALSGVHSTTIRRRAPSQTGPGLLFGCYRRKPLDERFEARIIS
jgi:hypothetical protein